MMQPKSLRDGFLPLSRKAILDVKKMKVSLSLGLKKAIQIVHISNYRKENYKLMSLYAICFLELEVFSMWWNKILLLLWDTSYFSLSLSSCPISLPPFFPCSYILHTHTHTQLYKINVGYVNFQYSTNCIDISLTTIERT